MEKFTIPIWIWRCSKLCLCNWNLRPKQSIPSNCRRLPTKQSKFENVIRMNWNRSLNGILHFQNNPNLDSRFDGSAGAAGNAPGYFGISTSSFSSASDVNGIKKHKEGAQTTVNDNGKVSTYAVEN